MAVIIPAIYDIQKVQEMFKWTNSQGIVTVKGLNVTLLIYNDQFTQKIHFMQGKFIPLQLVLWMYT
jgi:hypothetical protein